MDEKMPEGKCELGGNDGLCKIHPTCDLISSRLRKLEAVRQAALRNLHGKCTCDEAYKSRDMVDPGCGYCDEEELRGALCEAEEE